MSARFPRKVVALIGGPCLLAGGSIASATAEPSSRLPARFDPAAFGFGQVNALKAVAAADKLR